MPFVSNSLPVKEAVVCLMMMMNVLVIVNENQ